MASLLSVASASAAGTLSSYAVQGTDVTGSTGVAAVALGAPDYKFVNDALALPGIGSSSAVFGAGESAVLRFPVALRNVSGQPDLVLSAYVGGVGSSDDATVLVSVSADGINFSDVTTFNTAVARNRVEDAEENNFPGVKHFAVDFGAQDAITHVQVSVLASSAEGFRLDAAEGMHPAITAEHAFEIRLERYQAEAEERVKLRIKNLADSLHQPAQAITGFYLGHKTRVAVIADSVQPLPSSQGGQLACATGCASAGVPVAASTFQWSGGSSSGLLPGSEARHLRPDSLDINSGANTYLGGLEFSVTFADGYVFQFDYADVQAFASTGVLYQKYPYAGSNPTQSGPRPVEYYEFVDGPAIATAKFSNPASVGVSHTPGTGGRLRPRSQNFVEENLHVEAFWVQNNGNDFIADSVDVGHFHGLSSGYERAHGFESVPGLGPDTQGVYLQRFDGGVFNLLSLDYLVEAPLNEMRVRVSPTYNPAQPVAGQFVEFNVQRQAGFATLDLSQFVGVTSIFISFDLQTGTQHAQLDNIRVSVPEPMNVKPVANPGADQLVVDLDQNGVEPIVLDASASHDPDGTIVSWKWTNALGLVANGKIAQTTLPLGIHDFTLTVTDDDANLSTKSLRVLVGLQGGVPFANAGTNIISTDADGNGYESVHLDGSGSLDVGGQIVAAVWREIGGVQLGSGLTLDVPLTVGLHNIELTVTDDVGNISSDNVIVRVQTLIKQPADLIGIQTSEETTNKTTHTLNVNTLPIVEGDLLVSHMCADADSNGTTLTCPSGWTQVQSRTTTGAQRVAAAVCYREAIAADTTAPGFTFTTSNPQQSQSGVMLFRGQDPLMPIAGSAWRYNSNLTSPQSPLLNPVAPATARVLRLMCADGGRVTEGVGFPAGMASNLWLLESADGGTDPVSGGAALDVLGAAGMVEWTNALSVARESMNFTVAIAAGSTGPVGVAPVANAGTDIVVTDAGGDGVETVMLNGSGSSDADGTIVAWAWSEGGAPLTNTATANVAFAVGTHVVTLTVVDNSGKSGADTVVVTVNAAVVVNTPPVANAGTDIVVTDSDNTGLETVTLNGSGSSDTDGSIVSWSWTAGVGGPSLGSGSSVSIPFVVGVHDVVLVVVDDDGASSSDHVAVTVNAPVAPGPSYIGKQTSEEVTGKTIHTLRVNALPIMQGDLLVAHMCADKATALTCPVGWTQVKSVASTGVRRVAGAACYKQATMADTTATSYTFTTSSAQQSQSGVILLRGQDPLAPIAGIAVQRNENDTSPLSPALSPAAPASARLLRLMCADGGRVTEGVGFPVGMANNLWLLESADGDDGPVSGGAALDVPGAVGAAEWTNALSEARESVNFTVAIAAGSTTSSGVPVANAGTDIVVTDGDNNGLETVTLNGSGSSDTDGSIVSWSWTAGVGGPSLGSGSSVSVPFAVGVHDVVLVVVDDDGASSSDHVAVTVNAPVAPGPSYIGKQTSEEVTGKTIHTLSVNALPISEGDLLVAHMCADKATVLTCPAGWTQVKSVASTGVRRVAGAACYKQAIAADTTATSYTFTTSTAQQSQSGVILLRGQDPLAPIAGIAVQRNENDTSPLSPALSPAAPASARLLRLMCADGGRVTEGVGFPVGMANNLWLLESADGGDGPVSGGAALDVPGAVGAAEWTNALSEARESVNFTLAIKAGN